jgi:hypothetical protein
MLFLVISAVGLAKFEISENSVISAISRPGFYMISKFICKFFACDSEKTETPF